MTASDNLMLARDLVGRHTEFSNETWGLDAVAGRFIEISGGSGTAVLTACARLLVQAQRRGALTAWIGGNTCSFFPPDFAAVGIDLAALPVVTVNDVKAACHVADTLLRSGAFGVIALNLGERSRIAFAVQTRLAGLAKKHHTALLLLTRRGPSEDTGGSLVSLRADTQKRRTAHDCFLCEISIRKDKRRVAGWNHAEMCSGTPGLC